MYLLRSIHVHTEFNNRDISNHFLKPMILLMDFK